MGQSPRKDTNLTQPSSCCPEATCQRYDEPCHAMPCDGHQLADLWLTQVFEAPAAPLVVLRLPRTCHKDAFRPPFQRFDQQRPRTMECRNNKEHHVRISFKSWILSPLVKRSGSEGLVQTQSAVHSPHKVDLYHCPLGIQLRAAEHTKDQDQNHILLSPASACGSSCLAFCRVGVLINTTIVFEPRRVPVGLPYRATTDQLTSSHRVANATG